MAGRLTLSPQRVERGFFCGIQKIIPSFLNPGKKAAIHWIPDLVFASSGMTIVW